MTASTTKIARELRRNQTLAEQRMWRSLRNRQFHGLRFDRQYPIDHFIVDFCCREKRLVIEVDGGQHDSQRQSDEQRSEHLRSRGYTLVRFWNNEVMNNLEGVLERLAETVESSTSRYRPSL